MPPLAWHTCIDSNYISVYGSYNYFIIDTINGNILPIEASGCVEDSCIIGDSLFFMTNNGVSKKTNTYQSNLCHLSLNSDTAHTKNLLSVETNAIPCGISIINNKLYYLCKSYSPTFNGSETFLEEYDLNLNLLKRHAIDNNISSLVGSYNDTIVLSSIGEYLFFPFMINVHTPVFFR